MPNYVFVHGAFHGGWCFDRLRLLIEPLGHRVFAPTLSGLGERAHLARLGPINLDVHVEDIVQLLVWNDLRDVVLVGHSYGGMVVGSVADRVPDRICSLVYLDAIIPTSGASAVSLVPALKELCIDRSGQHGGLLVAPPQASHFGLEGADEAWVDECLRPHPLACFTQQAMLSGAYDHSRQRVLIYDVDRTAPASFPEQYESLRAAQNYHVYPLSGGHDLMITNSDGLAEILLDLPKDVARRSG